MSTDNAQTADNPTELATNLLEDLKANPPKSLTEAREKLTSLLAALRMCAAEQHSAMDLNKATTDIQAAMSKLGVHLEGIDAIVNTLVDVTKAEATANDALDRILKKFNSPKLDQRIWAKIGK